MRGAVKVYQNQGEPHSTRLTRPDAFTGAELSAIERTHKRMLV